MKFKERMGFQVVQVPVRLEMPPVCRFAMCGAKPFGCYRMAGEFRRLPSSVEAD